MAQVQAPSGTWGPLSQPIHGPVPDGMPPYKDNAYLAFWDTRAAAYGVFHASTSPNAEGRRARLSFQAGNAVAEVIEELEPGTFDSASIAFDLDETITIDSPGLTGKLTVTPHLSLADYNQNALVPELVEGEPLQHFQRPARVTGTLTLHGEAVRIDGFGLRDRTWGYRDESVSFVEYIGLMAIFEDFAVACMSFMGPDGETRTEGFRLGPQSAEPLDAMRVTRDASGLFAGGRFTGPTGQDVAVRTTSRPAGFWVPMGWERSGPTMAAYDEFVGLRTEDGAEGFALVEQGQIRRIY